jgi:hypothetical protein
MVSTINIHIHVSACTHANVSLGKIPKEDFGCQANITLLAK